MGHPISSNWKLKQKTPYILPEINKVYRYIPVRKINIQKEYIPEFRKYSVTPYGPEFEEDLYKAHPSQYQPFQQSNPQYRRYSNQMYKKRVSEYIPNYQSRKKYNKNHNSYNNQFNYFI